MYKIKKGLMFGIKRMAFNNLALNVLQSDFDNC